MKVQSEKTRHGSKPRRQPLADLSLGRLEISNEEILADLHYPAKPVREPR